MIVADASAVVDYVLWIGAAERIAERLSRTGESMHAPYLLDVEIAHALGRYALRGALSPVRVWELRENLTAFDAAYVALSEALDAPLVTSDAALARAPGHSARIEIFAG